MSQASVLLVDDNIHQHKIFECYAIGKEDLNLRHAQTIQQALLEIDVEIPDLILLDNRLHPFESFCDTIPLIRSRGYKGKIFVISADVSAPRMLNREQHSVSGFIDKFEFNLQNFCGKINSLLADPVC
jgi:DNA-binding NtrC family response regulator